MRRFPLSIALLALVACSPTGADGERPDGGAGKADDPGEGKTVFVTSTRYTGSLGGLEGADAICTDRASTAGLPGTFRAWLSTQTMSAAERLSHGTVPYWRTDGVRIADDWNDLTDGSLAIRIDRDEKGNQQTGDVWTGTLADGSVATAGTCDGFTQTAGAGQCGSTQANNAQWSVNLTPSCGTLLRLYCLEQ